MRRSPLVLVIVIGAVIAAGAIAVGVFFATRAAAPPAAAATARPVAAAPPSRRPRLPPGPDDPHPAPPPEPVMPRPSAEWRAATADRVRGMPHPGEAAFRALSDTYFDTNLELAREQAAHEGLTVPEVRELTTFGLMVLATQRVGDVEDIIGRALSDEEKAGLGGLMEGANEDFRRDMRALVARGASEAERRELIAATEARYRKDFYGLTGMNDALLDDLLAGNVLLPGAAASTPPPSGPTSPAEPRDDVVAPEKPK